MDSEPVRYRSADEDSARWLDFDFRPGDIVISTRSKSGTTWMQMICALLVFQTKMLPRPLADLSPWLDWLVVPKSDVYATLREQKHRRFIKTHTPLDGLPNDERVTFIVVARHPLDAAVSLYYQSQNIDRERLSELTSNGSASGATNTLPIDVWLRSWITSESSADENLDSIRGVFHHLSDAWRRRNQRNVQLIHYDDLIADLPGEMLKLASNLGIIVDGAAIAELAEAATFESMKSQGQSLAPDPAGVLKDRSAFFRRGRSGSGTEILRPEDLSAYKARAEQLSPPGLLSWLHRH